MDFVHQEEYISKDVYIYIYINDPVFLGIFKCTLKYFFLFTV